MGLAGKVIGLIERAIERWGDPDGEATMHEALRRCRDRAAELALENARLHDDLERKDERLNSILEAIGSGTPSPTLFREEQEVLERLLHMTEFELHIGLSVEDNRVLEDRAEIVRNLLNRCFKSELSTAEAKARINEAIYG